MKMIQISRHTLRRRLYALKHRYATTNNLVLLAALVIAAGWAWGSIDVMQRNFRLEQSLNAKVRQKDLGELEVQKLKFETKYHASDEYKDLAAREYLGLAGQNEKVLVLPENTTGAKRYDKDYAKANEPAVATRALTNPELWINFLLGGNAKNLQNIQ